MYELKVKKIIKKNGTIFYRMENGKTLINYRDMWYLGFDDFIEVSDAPFEVVDYLEEYCDNMDIVTCVRHRHSDDLYVIKDNSKVAVYDRTHC